MLQIIASDDTTRKFIVAIDGVAIELGYPQDIATFREFPELARITYISGFASHFRMAKIAELEKQYAQENEWPI